MPRRRFGIHVERYRRHARDAAARAAELRAEHAGRKIVLFVGRLVYYKGADVLVRAMADVDADLVIDRPRPARGRAARDRRRATAVADRITFLAAAATTPSSRAWYHAADVFCLPSVARSEAFGLVQLEAHAAGTPVVSTNLHHGRAVREPRRRHRAHRAASATRRALAAALNRLLGDDELRARLGAAGAASAR